MKEKAGRRNYSGERHGKMVKKKHFFILMPVFLIWAVTGCKQNVGTPEDNAVVEETEEEDDGQQDRLFGFSCPDLSDPYYEVLKDSVAIGLEDQGDRILVRDAERDAEKQDAQIREMAEAGVSAVFLTPVDPEGITPALDYLKEAGIPVINLDIRVQETGLTDAFVGADNYSAGAVCAEDLMRRMPAGGRIGIIECPSVSSVAERINGFEETIQDAGFEIVRRIDTKQDDALLNSELTRLLADENFPDALMCGDDGMALAAMEMIRNAGRNDVIIYSVGGSPAVKSALKTTDSALAGIGALSPISMGKSAIKTAAAILENRVYESDIYVETFFIDRENIDMYGTDGWQ